MKIFSDISLWWIIPWAFISLSIAFLYYRKQRQLEEIGKRKKMLLIGLRSLSLFLLGLLLFGLIIEKKEHKTEKPVFITLIDNSTSMLNYKDSSAVKKNIEAYRAALKIQFGERFDFSEFTIGADVKDALYDLRESESNLDKGFEYLYNQFYNRNIGGISFISDGNYNVGKNPIYSAEKISLTPVFTLGVGDTILKRDQLIKNVAANEVAFLNNEFPIEIDIEANKMGRISSEVSIWRGNSKIASEKIVYTDGNLDIHHVSMLLEAKEVGFVNYTVKIEHHENESSYQNNERSFYVEVIDARNKILVLASAPHPDVSALRQVMAKDENTQVEAMLISEWKGSLDGYALLVLHDPVVNSIENLRSEMKKHKTPVLYIIGNQTTSQNIEQLDIGLNFPRGNRLDEVQGFFNSGFQLFEVSDRLKNDLQIWPPLTVRFGNINMTGGKALISQRIGNVKKKDPILYFGNKTDSKFAVLLGEGLWRWKLAEYSKHGDNEGFNELIQNTVQYLTVKKNTEPLRIILPKRFNIRDEIQLNAEFYNSSFKKITEPNIHLVLKNDKGVDIDYEFAKNESNYSLSLGKLEKGKYDWVASTKFDGKAYKKNGSFVVEDVSLEAISTRSDHNLLNQISQKTNGQFYLLKDYQKMFNEIQKRKDIANITYEESRFDDLIDWKWLLFFIIILLSLEWFVRRYSGTY